MLSYINSIVDLNGSSGLKIVIKMNKKRIFDHSISIHVRNISKDYILIPKVSIDFIIK